MSLAHAGVDHHDVDASELPARLVERSLDGLTVANVSRDRESPPAAGYDLGRRTL
jgi:hypothetical protein